jgi:Carboxylesterase family
MLSRSQIRQGRKRPQLTYMEEAMTGRRIMSATLLLLSATAFAGVTLAAPGGIPGPNPNAPGQQKKANGPTVNTTDGPVQGFVENGVNKFLGIPFAAPPVGDLR